MAFTINTAHTLPEILRHNAPDGSYMAARDVLKKNLPMIEETYWEQANEETSHEFLKTVSKPTGALVRYEEGAPFEISTDRAVREQLCRIEGNLRVDVRVLAKSANPGAYYREKEMRYFEGMLNTFHETIFSKNSRGNMGTNPKDINGLGVRRPVSSAVAIGSETATTTVVNMGNSTGGSIWLIKHGGDGLFMLHPRTAANTIKQEQFENQLVYDANSYPFRADMTNFSMEFGLGIVNDMAVQRLCNIALTGNHSFFGDGTTVQKGEYALIDMISRLPGGSTEGCVLYVGPQIMSGIRKRLNDKTNMNYTKETVWGREMPTFMGIPIVQIDTLTADETSAS